MMRTLLLLMFTSTVLFAQAHQIDRMQISYWLDTSAVDSTLEAGQAVYEFKFQNGSIDGKIGIVYSIDGKTERASILNNTLVVKTSPGKHIFQIYYSQDFEEVYTDSLTIQEGYRDRYKVNLFNANYYPVEMDKPVIYLYPTKETAVSVKLDIKGETSFTYPVLDESWEFVAQSNGDLTFGDKTYNYLFWESQQSRYLDHSEVKKGFIVHHDEVVSFLEKKLTEAGLNSKEQADFITYWGPRLSAHEMTFVRFEFNEVCNRYAEMDITPTPDNIYRIYMSWMPIEEEMVVEPQEIIPITRTGFTVLEWGGFETTRSYSYQNRNLTKTEL